MKLYWLEQSEADIPADDQWLSAHETIRLHSLHVAKRRADWRLGRWTAKCALAARLQLSAERSQFAGIEIRAALSGSPEVFFHDQPADIAISLSHSDRTALCTAGPRDVRFGCDLETIETHSEAFVDDYFTDDERALLQRSSLQKRPLLTSLLWSAKESALKALRVGLRLDTRCVCVTPLHAWPQESSNEKKFASFTPTPANPDAWRPLCVSYLGQAFAGWWRVQDHQVRTVVADSRLGIPQRVPAAFTK